MNDISGIYFMYLLNTESVSEENYKSHLQCNSNDLSLGDGNPYKMSQIEQERSFFV